MAAFPGRNVLPTGQRQAALAADRAHLHAARPQLVAADRAAPCGLLVATAGPESTYGYCADGRTGPGRRQFGSTLPKCRRQFGRARPKCRRQSGRARRTGPVWRTSGPFVREALRLDADGRRTAKHAGAAGEIRQLQPPLSGGGGRRRDGARRGGRARARPGARSVRTRGLAALVAEEFRGPGPHGAALYEGRAALARQRHRCDTRVASVADGALARHPRRGVYKREDR